MAHAQIVKLAQRAMQHAQAKPQRICRGTSMKHWPEWASPSKTRTQNIPRASRE
eukprot:CAMPEP_0183332682 /NCGR_PEP_ID=MMETSP0164_2-20130417/1784_1 /TAXON_ID=221442 /ORGANISM="Coccolithus pelagicus ssp braarudi, Strain PLY182g" /LENGTH=53 /DNA_ID=CAMNT_0025501449 /DNA_START=418 /DNA_END=579 /DNA_ORIENTATION=-